VLREICGKHMLWHMLNRVRLSKRLDDIVLAIPDSAQNARLEQFARQFAFHYFRGSERDVLSRYYEAAKKFDADVIVRLTSDCPLIDPRATDKVIEEYLNADADYTSNIIKRTYPLGLDTEAFNYGVLEKAHKEAKKEYEREHVTPYIYQHPNLFKLKSVETNGKLRRPDLRLTVDTEEDLQLIRQIFNRLYRDGEIFYTKDVIDLLDKHPELVAINANIGQKKLCE
jgi:spore coat polysaccharide biosynthesis protein SpsF